MNLTLPTRGVLSSITHSVISFAKKLLTILLISGFFLSISMQANAQEQNDNWKLLTTIDGVQISYQKTSCDDNETLTIKAVNTNNQDITLDLKYNFTANFDDSNMGNGTLGKIALEANAEKVSTCGDDLSINVYEHFSMFNEKEFTLTVTKSE